MYIGEPEGPHPTTTISHVLYEDMGGSWNLLSSTELHGISRIPRHPSNIDDVLSKSGFNKWKKACERF